MSSGTVLTRARNANPSKAGVFRSFEAGVQAFLHFNKRKLNN